MEKDDDGSYLISLRGPSTIYKISQDGDILWRLGGQNSSFAMGDNTSFHYQHDARWLNASDVNPRYMSLFDNNVSPPLLVAFTIEHVSYKAPVFQTPLPAYWRR